ncbi:TetR/AcrR family transcriptional regulator [Cohnella nanjingensis]|uniref:TetR/AcrR family transcriptional regulator n=1 Tax=Cohnella nanjingensis TaxID=1387779 RepID=A0A7X0VI48_9BACL|nr:TetR/AcrR family transcriptional regulator [Cohnella nanjingensis]MBB6674842.1 TetR/AcrR family transcriptional regulator [Cohnella nanjingensis]
MYTKETAPKADLRVKRTRKLLWESLMSLLESRPFDAITVNEICERAMVHRTTFYKHFEDKIHLMSHGLQEISLRYAEESYEDRIRRPIQMFQKLGHLKQFRSLLQAVNDNPALKDVMHRQGAELLKTDLLELQKEGRPFAVPIEVIAEFYTGAVAGLGSWWLLNDMPVSAEQMDEYLARLIHPEIFFPGQAADCRCEE